ncbi:MAG: peptidase M19, renal dipeptidase [Ktedonobacterales bacterium]|jgi:membrane dipeptidase|nr:MAG: peptidase M19, renal dipeptidase [Ktedonobacterales bacterium]
MFIVDAHEDIAYNALHHNRDVRSSVAETRTREATVPPPEDGVLSGASELAMVGLPEHRQGGVGLIFATIFVPPGEPAAMTSDGFSQLQYYHNLAAENIGVRLVTSRDELARLRHDWQAASTPDARPVGMALLMEGADPLPNPSALEHWYGQGLRMLGTSWRGTRYAGGTREPGPLTDLGRALLAEMTRLNMILDISHMAEESFWEALAQFNGPVIASHSNCRIYVPTDRHLSDDMIRAITERDGVIGTVLANQFLVGGWEHSQPLPRLDAVVQHIDHICQLTGTSRHCAIGSDFDGGFGVASTPEELDSVADLSKIGDALKHSGYTEADIQGVLGGNWLRLLQEALPDEQTQ